MNGPQPFRNVPVIGQQQNQFQAQVSAAIHSLSVQIYTQLASQCILHSGIPEGFDADKLRQLAKDASLAARAYFEGVGIIQTTNQHGETP